ncbi:YxeA family protein [Pediococcus argentinicus]|uniref:YxeA family protein n=1 Tax=Pediococcus argentinicus TaxID=480391 RepID=A0A0R2N6U8_9LACO|nr:YxeA family protein [Pediococcus argentinicus]KRO21598.1 hypothetical protein IV88_GL001350 [Pediococcus argentinicus]NKZ23127.1 YxeA family protein [Pediococcus argentinicus]GEP20279.1 hypothetical protein LSA03_16630 [Pediococcus argentinicus]
MNSRSNIFLIILAVVITGATAAFVTYNHTTDYYGQVGNVDKVSTDKDDRGISTKTYQYKIQGYTTNGDSKVLTVKSFNGHKFTKGHYIRMEWSKYQGVRDYQGIPRSEVPGKIAEKLK